MEILILTLIGTIVGLVGPDFIYIYIFRYYAPYITYI